MITKHVESLGVRILSSVASLDSEVWLQHPTTVLFKLRQIAGGFQWSHWSYLVDQGSLVPSPNKPHPFISSCFSRPQRWRKWAKMPWNSAFKLLTLGWGHSEFHPFVWRVEWVTYNLQMQAQLVYIWSCHVIILYYHMQQTVDQYRTALPSKASHVTLPSRAIQAT